METKSSRTLQSEATREKIIEVASQLFLRKGYFGTSIADLAKGVHLTKGALYHHFASKEAILSAVLSSIKKVWKETVVREVIAVQDPMERLEKLLESHAQYIQKNESFCLILNGLLMEMDGINSELTGELKSIYSEMAGFIEGILVKGQATGIIRHDINPKSTTLIIVGMLRGTGCSRSVFEKTDCDFATTMEALEKIIIRGMRA